MNIPLESYIFFIGFIFCWLSYQLWKTSKATNNNSSLTHSDTSKATTKDISLTHEKEIKP